MAIELILFDFDGTIADTLEVFIEIVNELSGEFGYQPVNREDVERFRNLGSREVIKQSHVCPVKIPFILKRIKIKLSPKIQDVKPISEIEPYLFQLKNKGYRLGIITSNHQNNVINFLSNNQLDSLFDLIYSGVTLFGKDKVINKVIKQNNLMPDAVIYVGDETRDISAAKKSKVKVIAVGWGFNSPEALARFKPDFLISHPQELVEVVESCDLHRTG